MSKAVSTREAQNKLSSLIGWVNEHNESVIVEKRGAPAAVLMSYAEYESLQGVKEQQRRQELLAKMRDLRARVSSRNPNLSEADAETLADEVTADAVASLVERGRIRFEQ
ncbi:MAG TPA: type II toxin-antitoxin system Phd/YefM family antitoxin [Thermomicrobiales bacterium]|jgi:prevent-host-death family protein